ncbi:putative terpene synthase 9 [Hibiscus syriacus]|uniref:Terpene synthase 9 n=1 Tax=Hibiscus syriacus TaxID=106335 RepID=A0A6A2Y6M9_HIBSY|nr:probable terpene synthase 9 [Hibiscus syriacus]KAE8666347.1 putative terpene synthase 9 [Hibiscus syriacus]
MAPTPQSAEEEQRRSANYHPTIWDPTAIKSFTTPYTYELYGTQLEDLKQKVGKLLGSTKGIASLLKLIDSLKRLGVAYHFQQQIQQALDQLNVDQNLVSYDLSTVAVRFRLLRENGYPVTADVLAKFKGGDGKFMSGDVEELLSLNEASFMAIQGEEILEEAKCFSNQSLKILLGKMEEVKAKQIVRSLEVPLHWRMERVEARNFIDSYAMDDSKSSVLLDLAKLNYNLVQSAYQQELKQLAEWWRELNFKEKLSFSRDRLMEIYFWATGLSFEPQYAKCRICFTKYACLATVVDDIYDIYGSLDELERFTKAVTGWDVKAVQELPEYMRVMFSAMSDFTNELAQQTMNDHGLDVLPYIKEQWAILCRAHITEARWFYGGQTPTFNEYIENGWVSIGSLGGLVLLCFVEVDSIADRFPNCLEDYSQLFYWSSLVTRLSDDLGTSKAEMERGDIPKAVQSYMIEKGVSEEEARDHVKELISYAWKKMNEEVVDNCFPQVMVNLAKNMARTAQCMYQHGDGVGTSTGVTKDCIVSSILKPIPF